MANSTILAFETAILGGSIAVFSNNELLVSECGEAAASRAEDLIPNIHKALRSASLILSDIDHIAVSTGPGSYTGIRIGLSTALGLKAASTAKLTATTALAAIAHSTRRHLQTISAIPMGREDVAWQIFNNRESTAQEGTPEIGDMNEFTEYLRRLDSPANVIVHPVVFSRLASAAASLPATVTLIESDANIAFYIAGAASAGHTSSELAPLYLLNPARSKGLF